MSHELKQGGAFWLRLLSPFIFCILLAAPALSALTGSWHPDAVFGAVIFGVAIISAAFMLGWVGEAAELDLSGGLAVGLLAVIAILPEYIVSIYFAFAAGTDPAMAAYASANITGANRLLLGLGWPAVALIGFLAIRLGLNKKGGSRKFGIQLEGESRTDLGFLIFASAIALIIPLTGQMHLLVGIVLIAIFVIYLWRQSHAEREEPELEGTAAYVGALPKWGRRAFILTAVLVAAAIIMASAEPFAHYLIEAGQVLGVDDYLLVQWLAPIASEAPEFALALLFASRGKPGVGLAILVSSKVNQWTALVGSLPVAYVVGGGGAALPLDPRQMEEFALTTAQTLLGVALLLGLRLGFRASALLFVLFITTFVFPQTEVRIWLAGAYFVLAGFMAFFNRKHLAGTLKAPFQLPKKLV